MSKDKSSISCQHGKGFNCKACYAAPAADGAGLCVGCADPVRPGAVRVSPLRPDVIRERVEQADAYLNDAALPSYGELARTLNGLVLDPRLEGYESEALARAELLCDRLREVLA